MSPSLIVADDVADETKVFVAGKVLIIIAIILASITIAIILTVLTYFILRFLKRKMCEPQYYIDNAPVEKDISEFNDENNKIYIQVPDTNQTQSILSIPYMITSVRQSLIDLGHSLVPFSWSQVQHVYNQENPVNEKTDLSV